MSRTLSPLTDATMCMVFFTRIPLPHVDIKDRKLGDAIWAAPIAGLMVAVVGALAYTICHMFDVPSRPAAAVALAAMMLATGCLHEDGLSDTADGFGGGKTLERKLEIMRDSRLGSYGAAALMGSMLIRWAALSTILDGTAFICALIAAQAGSRGIFGVLLRHTHLARESGLAGSVGEVSDTVSKAGLAMTAIALLFLGLWTAIITAIVLALCLLAFRALCRQQIGGMTGDTLGDAQQIAEIVILLAAAAAFS